MKKIDRCPRCGVRLITGEGFNKICKTPNCTFVDRRKGNTMMDMRFDRREGGVVGHAPMMNPWEHVKMFR
jgi:hypothetical protein